MENLILRFVFDRKKQATDTKKGLLQIEVRRMNTSKRVFISTGIKLYGNQFTEKKWLYLQKSRFGDFDNR